jgi:MFS family permease
MATNTSTSDQPGTIRSLIPARIDRLPWSRFHTHLIVALGVAWVLDGLEITIASNVGPDLTQPSALGWSASAVADIATWYLIGQVFGALIFGRLSDKLGRRKLFMITLGIYLVGSGLTAATPKGGYWFIFLYATRVLAGAGIGGEYAAINSAIDEMIPAKFRGRVDLAVNGTYWAGALLGTLFTLLVLNTLSSGTSWRVAYVAGPVLALVIIYVRKSLPESPRWQIMHGQVDEAEGSIAEIEHDVSRTKGALPPVDQSKELEIRPSKRYGYPALIEVLFRHYPGRSTLVAALMITQSFLYNAIFFTYGLVLQYFFHVSTKDTGWYFLAFAAGNLLGPLTLGRLFDTVGRKQMIAGTYIIAGVLLVITAQFFKAGDLNATTQTLCWAVIFFFASAGASAGYLTASEVFPIEVRAQAIAVFFAIAQLFGSLGSHLYGHLIGSGNDPNRLYWGYLLGAGMMIIGGVVEIFLGVDAAGKSLEEVAKPLSVIAKPSEAAFRAGDSSGLSGKTLDVGNIDHPIPGRHKLPGMRRSSASETHEPASGDKDQPLPKAGYPACDLRRSRRMICRSWVIRAVPAAAITSAPAMAASSSATASDKCRWAPRKLMLTAFAFWMMKMSTTTRTTMPAISAMRMLLIRVRSRRRGGCGAGTGGAEPLSDGGGRVLVAPGGVTGSVMTGLP